MLTKTIAATLEGVEGTLVTVEVDIRRGMPTFTIVGLADTTIKEACSRMKPAVLNSGFDFPDERVTVNLVPAGKPKEGTHFDLPIAVGMITPELGFLIPEDTAFLGELSLDGKLNRIKGALPLVMCLRKQGIKKVILPIGNAEETAILKDVDIMPAEDLDQVIRHVAGSSRLPVYKGKKISVSYDGDLDFSQVAGQETVKRAVVIGVAGNHGLLLMGGPGCGKTMIARRIPTIMPEPTYDEMLEITGVYSVSGLLSEAQPFIDRRPFRSPHHTISSSGLLGGGVRPRPGEISLAHRGVLFLDEMGEFDGGVLDAMRQPMEEGLVRITRNNREVTFPAQVMVVAAANPCKCGHLWDDRKICTCSRKQLDDYARKLNGPFSDRIDMHIKMFPVDKDVVAGDIYRRNSISSAEMRRQVTDAVNIQRERYTDTKYRSNGDLDEKGIEIYCRLDKNCSKLLSLAYDRLGLSMRACSRSIKVARTIADLAGETKIREEHLTEALMYRMPDGGQQARQS